MIRVKSVTTASIPTDKAPKGASKGDRVVMRDRLLNAARQFGKPAGAAVGRDEGVLLLTGESAATFTGVDDAAGRHAPAPRVRPARREGRAFSSIGGTGKYAGARGTLEVGDGKSPLNVYHLMLPSKDPAPVTLSA